MRDTARGVEVVHGLWWWPDAPDQKFPGSLEMTGSEHPVLTIYGTRTNTDFHVPLMCGKAIGGKYFTLLNCYQRGSQSSWDKELDVDVEVARYTVLVVLRDASFEDPGQVRFRHALVGFEGLREWSGPPGLRFARTPVAEYEPVPPVSARVGHTEIVIESGLSRERERHEVVLRDEAHVSIVSGQALSLDQWERQYVRPLGNLLTLFIGRPAFPSGIRFPDGDERMSRRIIEVFSQRQSGSASEVSRYEMRITLPHLADEWSSVLDRWLSLSGKDNGMLDVFFSTQYQADMFIEQKFLGVVQSLEVFHRMNYENCVIPKDDHERRTQEVLSVAPQQHKKWLKGLMKYGNALRLEPRLLSLIEEAEELLAPFITDPKGVAQRVRATRNFLVHRSDQPTEVIPPEEMWDWYYVLSLMMSAALFRYLLPDNPAAGLYPGASHEYAFQKSRISLP